MNLESLLETKHSLGRSKYGTIREAATVDLDGDDIMIPPFHLAVVHHRGNTCTTLS